VGREDAVNEIRILASIKHRNIVRCGHTTPLVAGSCRRARASHPPPPSPAAAIRYCDAFVERDNLYIVMEFAEGGDIGRQVDKFRKANKYVKEDHIWSYTVQMCRALHELHSRSILHRVRGTWGQRGEGGGCRQPKPLRGHP
jgi:serine/threonine protein kinase